MRFSRQKTFYQSELDQFFIELKKQDPSLTARQKAGIHVAQRKNYLGMNDIYTITNKAIPVKHKLKQP